MFTDLLVTFVDDLRFFVNQNDSSKEFLHQCELLVILYNSQNEERTIDHLFKYINKLLENTPPDQNNFLKKFNDDLTNYCQNKYEIDITDTDDSLSIQSKKNHKLINKALIDNSVPSLNSFIEELSQLKRFSSTKIKLLIKEATKRIKHHLNTHQINTITPPVISLFKQICEQRHNEMLSADRSYTSHLSEEDIDWIKLVTKLKQQGYIQEDIYCFLMPTLQHDTDPVRLLPLSNLPLSHFILSESNKELILLSNSKKNYKAVGFFDNCNTHPTTPFSDIEIGRIAFADKKYANFYRKIQQTRPKNSAISRYTLHKINFLANNIFISKGLYAGDWYAPREHFRALIACKLFDHWYLQIPACEKTRLMSQSMSLYRKEPRFKTLYSQLQTDYCATTIAKYLTILNLAYSSDDVACSKHIDEHWTELNTIREEFRTGARLHNVYRDFDSIDEKGSIDRLKEIYIAWKRQFFSHPQRPSLIIKLAQQNKKLFNQLEAMIINNSFPQSRFFYSQLIIQIESILDQSDKLLLIPRSSGEQNELNEAMDDITNQLIDTLNTWVSSEHLQTNLMISPSDINEIIANLRDEFKAQDSLSCSLPTLANKVSFDAKSLVVDADVLLTISIKTALSSPTKMHFLDAFVDKLVTIFINTPNHDSIDINLNSNIELAAQLSIWNCSFSREFLKTLSQSGSTIKKNEDHALCQQWLFHRIATTGAFIYQTNFMSFFSTGAVIVDDYDKIINCLRTLEFNRNHSADDLINRLPSVCQNQNEKEMNQIRIYINKLIDLKSTNMVQEDNVFIRTVDNRSKTI